MAKELILTFDEVFSKGLRQNNRLPKNSPCFSSLQNVRVMREGLVAYEPVLQPISSSELGSASVATDFPFPQLFRGKAVTLLVDETRVFLVDESDWSLTLVTTYDLYNTSSTKSIPTGQSWQFVDFWNTWMLFNGVCSVIKFGGDAKYYVQDTLTVQTGCAHRGRAIQAGFSTSDFWSSTWKTFWTSRILEDNPPNSSILQTMADIGPNFVWWSTIGGGDLRFLHNPTWATTGPYGVGHTSEHPMVMDFVRRNEWGWMPMTFQGSVLCVKSLGPHLFVGGEDGINILTQYAAPTPTFGLTKTLPFGILSRNAVGGDNERLVFLDEDACLWTIDSGLNLERLDYTEYFNFMLGTDVIITTDPQQGHYFISNHADCYSLSRDMGLSKTHQHLTSLEWCQGGPVGIFTEESDTSFMGVTEVFNMGYTGLKQIQQVTITGEPPFDLEVAFDYRNSSSDAWRRTAFIKTNSECVCTHIITANDFRLVIRKPDGYTGVKIERVDITWKPVDRRYTHS